MALLAIFILSLSIFIPYLKYQEYKTREEMRLDLNVSAKLVESHFQNYRASYNSTSSTYLNKKVDEDDSRVAIDRVLLLRSKLIQLNISKNKIEDVDRCLNKTYNFYHTEEFYDALTQARVCAILASDYLGSHLVATNRTEFLDYTFKELQNITIIKDDIEGRWEEKMKNGVEFTDYMVTGLKIEHNLIEAEIFLNRSAISLEKLKQEHTPTTPEEAENLTLLGSRITNDLEYARSFLEDALVLMRHVNMGNFQPTELESEVDMLRKNLSEIDRPCNITVMMAKVACDWKDYHKRRGIIALQKGYYSAANYHLLYSIAIAEGLREFKSLALEFNSSKSLTDKAKIILRLRGEAINSLEECSRDTITSLYLKDPTGWYFKRAENTLRNTLNPEIPYSIYRTHDYDSHIVYDYEMTKVLAQKFCPYLTVMTKGYE